MSAKTLGAIFTIVGAIMMIATLPYEPFSSNYEGGLIWFAELAGPFVFSIGATVFGFQIYTYVKEEEWPEFVPQKLLIGSIVFGLLASVIVFLVRIY